MLTTLLDAIKTRNTRRHSSAWQIVLRAADATATGQPVADVDELAEAMASTSRTEADFEAMVETMRTRREKLALARTQTEAAATAAKKRSAFEAEKAKFAEAERAYRDRATKLLDAAVVEESRASRAAMAAEWLCDPRHMVGPIRARYEAALGEAQAAREAAGSCRRAIREARDAIRQAEGFVSQFGSTDRERSGSTGLPIKSMDDSPADPDKLAEWTRRLESRRKALRELEASQQRADAVVAEAEEAVTQIRTAILRGDLT